MHLTCLISCLLWQGIRRMRETKETVILHSCPQFPKMFLLHFNWMSQMKATTSWNCGLRFMSFGFAWRTEWYKTRPGSYSINNEKGANSVSVWGICIQKLVMLVYSKQNADTVGCMNHDIWVINPLIYCQPWYCCYLCATWGAASICSMSKQSSCPAKFMPATWILIPRVSR